MIRRPVSEPSALGMVYPSPAPPSPRMQAKRNAEIGKAINLIETLGPDVAWSIGTIVNETHMMQPYGRGLMVALRGPGTDLHPGPIMVVDKSGEGVLDATVRAVARFKKRQQGMRLA